MAQDGAGEPTEEPTPRRLEESRRRGEVAISRDLASAAAMTAAIVAVVVVAPGLVAGLIGYFRGALGAAAAAPPAGPALRAGVGVLIETLAAPVGAALTVALFVGLLQTRGLLALEAVRPDLGRLSPAEGLKRAFGGQAVVEIAKGVVKVALVAALAWVTVRPVLAGLVHLVAAPPAKILAALGLLSERLASRVAVVALLLGVADYLLVRRRHLRRLRMTREEVRRETKETEGDPGHRSERQRLHRELLEQRMVAEVRKADFVVVNPDHIAVALRYDREGDAAPMVVARGERRLAERIRTVAREAGVPIFRDVTLARSLRNLPEGEEIPAALYEAVAEILRVVYRTTAAGPSQAPSPGDPPPSSVPGAGWRRV